MTDRLATCAALGLALFWCGAMQFLRWGSMPDWWLPMALAIGLGGAGAATAGPRAAAPRWLRAGAASIVAIAVAAVAYGAVATPSRHWDGAAATDVKAFWLAHAPTLQQPFFAAPGVFHHSPDYPLLVPLSIAAVERVVPGMGRLALPALFLLLLGIAAACLQRCGVRPWLGSATVVAIALLPALISPGGGAVDSGYGELAVLLATTAIAAGMLADRPLWSGLGALLAVAAKPEGLAYGLVAVAVPFARGERPQWLAALGGLAIGLWCWAPVRQILLHQPPAAGLSTAALPGIAIAAAVAVDRVLAGWRAGVAVRWSLVLGAPAAALALLPCYSGAFAGQPGVLGAYLGRGDRLVTGLGNLPRYGLALLDHGVARLRFGATFVLPAAALLCAWRAQVRLPGATACGFALLGLAATALPFVLSPEADLDHHLRSSLPRLLLHWTGPLWLLSATWIDALLRPAPTGQPPAVAPGR